MGIMNPFKNLVAQLILNKRTQCEIIAFMDYIMVNDCLYINVFMLSIFLG